MQTPLDGAPNPVENVPAMQPTQALEVGAPTVVEKAPATQSVHTTATPPYLPATHAAHALAPVADAKVPATHATQATLGLNWPSPVAKLPTAQPLQANDALVAPVPVP